MQSRFLLALFNYVLLRLLKRMYFLLRNNAEAVLRFEEGSIRDRDIKESIENFNPPSIQVCVKMVYIKLPDNIYSHPQSMKLQLGLYRWVASPQFYGWDNVPDRPTKPLIFIGNHAIVVISNSLPPSPLPPPPQHQLPVSHFMYLLKQALEVPLLIYELYKQKHIFPRAMGDHTHFKIPVWGKILSAFGVVDGTREICGKILSRGYCLLPCVYYFIIVPPPSFKHSPFAQ